MSKKKKKKKKMRVSEEEFYETGKARIKTSISGEVSTTQSKGQNDNPKKTKKSWNDQRE